MMFASLMERMRAAARARFVCPHYHAYIRRNQGAEHRLSLPEDCELDPEFIADPFLVQKDGSSWLFFEGLFADRGNRGRSKGVIGCLEQKGGTFEYRGIVLEEPWHLSFPNVFEDEGRWYMIPESGQSGCVSLYESVDFPFRWKKRHDLIFGNCNYVDAAFVREDGCAYLIVTPAVAPARPEVWTSERIEGPWRKHPKGDCVSASLALRRNGGAIIREGARLYRIAQDCSEGYGRRLYRIPILKLTPTEYAEGEPEELSAVLKWPQPLPYHTYNSLVDGNQTLEVVDRHFYTLKATCNLIASVGWFVIDGLRVCARRALRQE